METRTIGIRELKNRLSAILKRVREGEKVLVTDRGRVVGELLQPRFAEPPSGVHPGLEVLVRRGVLSAGAPNHAGLYPVFSPLLPPGVTARLLDEERGPR